MVRPHLSRTAKVGGGIATLALAGALFTGTAFAASNTATPTTGSTSTTTTTQTTQTSRLQQFENRLAQNLGISVDQLTQALKKTSDQSVDAAVTAGKITSAQGTTLKQQIDSGQANPLFGIGPMRGMGGPHQGMPGMLGGDEASTIASTLGITTTQLQSEISGGKTLPAVITEHGKTVADVVNALVAKEKSELDAQVKAGTLAADQETIDLNNLTQQLTNAINNNTFGPGHGPGDFGGRRGGPMGGMGSGSSSTTPSSTPTN